MPIEEKNEDTSMGKKKSLYLQGEEIIQKEPIPLHLHDSAGF